MVQTPLDGIVLVTNGMFTCENSAKKFGGNVAFDERNIDTSKSANFSHAKLQSTLEIKNINGSELGGVRKVSLHNYVDRGRYVAQVIELKHGVFLQGEHCTPKVKQQNLKAIIRVKRQMVMKS